MPYNFNRFQIENTFLLEELQEMWLAVNGTFQRGVRSSTTEEEVANLATASDWPAVQWSEGERPGVSGHW